MLGLLHDKFARDLADDLHQIPLTDLIDLSDDFLLTDPLAKDIIMAQISRQLLVDDIEFLIILLELIFPHLDDHLGVFCLQLRQISRLDEHLGQVLDRAADKEIIQCQTGVARGWKRNK